jgi:hypothetical protein
MECPNFRVCKKDNPFTKEDFNSGDGMLTYVWGPGLWHALHTMSFNYPVKPTKEDKTNYLIYFKSLVNILPCKYCRENYKKNTSKGNTTHLTIKIMKNRESLSRWLFNLHEKINTNLGKKSGLTYEVVRNRYENFRARCLENKKDLEKKAKELGCVNPLHGVKSKCIIRIVPKDSKYKTFQMDPKCIIKKDLKRNKSIKKSKKRSKKRSKK